MSIPRLYRLERHLLDADYWMPTLASVILFPPTDFGRSWLPCPITSRKGRLLGTIAAHHRPRLSIP